MTPEFSDLGSARASRAGFGASPKRSYSPQNKFAMARAPSPAREARALPREERTALPFEQ